MALHKMELMPLLDAALDYLDEEKEFNGLGSVIVPEERNGVWGMTLKTLLFRDSDILTAYRSNMRQMIREDMVGMLLGVKNILPGEETYKDIKLHLMASEKEATLSTVAEAMDHALIRNNDFFEGPRVLLVTGLTIDRTFLNAKRVGDGDTEFYDRDGEWDTNPGIQAMRYWMDMP